MSRHHSIHAGARVLGTSLFLTIIFAAGSAVGIYLYPRIIVEAGENQPDREADEWSDSSAPDDEPDHVVLSKQACANIDLQIGHVSRGDYWKTLLVPARVVEIPGRSDLSIPAPVTGVVESVQVLPGQSLTMTADLFTIRLTDEALIDAQSKLLETLARREVTQQEIARLDPIIESGAVSGARRREKNYELRQLQAQQSTLLQELRSRGLPQSMIDTLLDDQVLASTLTVHAPSFVGNERVRDQGQSSGFSVEQLLVHPGRSVVRGQPLCTVAYHSELYLEGTAFEDDLPILNKIAENEWSITVESHGASDHDAHPHGLQLLRIDNHVDEETQTVKFFVELPNEVTGSRQADGRLFEQWRYRPGQRLHVRLPVEHWENQLILPRDAVVFDGPNVFVFAEHCEAEVELPRKPSSAEQRLTSDNQPVLATDAGRPTEREEDGFIEFEPVSLTLLHRDDKTVVIADDGQIRDDTSIALNNAYKLYLAMKMQVAGGGGLHDHDH